MVFIELAEQRRGGAAAEAEETAQKVSLFSISHSISVCFVLHL